MKKLMLVSALLLLTALPAFASGAAEQEIITQTYEAPGLTGTALEALLWQACPEDDECMVRRRDEVVGLTAPLSTHRGVAKRLADLEQAGAAQVRIDLVATNRGGGAALEGLPASVRVALQEHGVEPGVGFTPLDSALVSIADRAQVRFHAAGQTFAATLNHRRGTLETPVHRHIALYVDKTPDDPDAVSGQILSTVAPLVPGQTTLAGTTHYRTDGTELLVLITPLS